MNEYHTYELVAGVSIIQCQGNMSANGYRSTREQARCWHVSASYSARPP